jgi:hypothetical protein
MKLNVTKGAVRGVVGLTVAAGITIAGAGTAFAATPTPSNADEATQMHVTVDNTSGLNLQLVSGEHAGGVTHWQQQAQQTLDANSSEVVTDYGSGNNSIDLTYQDAAGNTYTFHASDPLMDYNSASASTTNTSFTVNSQYSTGHNDYTTFTIVPGHTFDYTGAAQTFVVPPGVTELGVDVIGGSGGCAGKPGVFTSGKVTDGAEITGTLAVTPGQTLTIGAGGEGNCSPSNYYGGWGLSTGTDSYAGGNGVALNSGAGGGASAILGSDDTPLVVAGGGGGTGFEPPADGPGYEDEMGGNGGYGGSLTGQNGQGGTVGGLAGNQSTHQGQAVTIDSSTGPGAGGGGYAGGGAGMTGSDGGGGAGSSYDADLTGATVQTAPVVYQSEENGSIVLTAVN